MTDEKREEFKTLDPAAQRTLLYQLGLFPACGHHRVKASLELAKENPEYKYLEKWSGVRVIAPLQVRCEFGPHPTTTSQCTPKCPRTR